MANKDPLAGWNPDNNASQPTQATDPLVGWFPESPTKVALKPLPYTTPYTGMEKFGGSVGNAFLNTFKYGPLDALYGLASSQESDPNGPYHRKAQELSAEIASRKEMFAPAENSWPGLAGNIAEKAGEQLAMTTIGLGKGMLNVGSWIGEGLTQPGSIADRIQSGASNAIGSVLGNTINTGINKATNAVQGNWKPEMQQAAVKDIDLRNNGFQGTYSGVVPPSRKMADFENWITNNGATNNRLVDAFKNIGQKIQDQDKVLWNIVDTNAKTAGNPIVDANNTSRALKGFVNDHGYDTLIAGAPTKPDAARMLVMADREMADEAVSLLVRAGRSEDSAIAMVNQFLKDGTNLPFDAFRRVQRGIGAVSRNLNKNPNIPGEAITAANSAYGATFNDLDSILNNASGLKQVENASVLLKSLQEARNYHRDVARPWETGITKTPEGAQVNLPIVSQLSKGVYDTNPNQIIKDVLNSKNNAMMSNYYGSTLDEPTQRLINSIQSDPQRAMAWANMKKEVAPSTPPSSNTLLGIARGKYASMTDTLDRNPAYKNYRFANSDVVPSGTGWGGILDPALKNAANVGVLGTTMGTAPNLGALSVLAAHHLRNQIPSWVPVLGKDTSHVSSNMGISQDIGKSN